MQEEKKRNREKKRSFEKFTNRDHYRKRTDLALEVQESFPEDHVEIPGVKLEEHREEKEKIKITTVSITSQEGAKRMQKPIGTYVTIEFKDLPYQSLQEKQHYENRIAYHIGKCLMSMITPKKKEGNTLLAFGLGNRFATPDALGPVVMEHMIPTRHLYKDSSENHKKSSYELCSICPGVMGQTGMESSEILQGVVKEIHPDVLVVVDALASSSIGRLCRTIQITDSGICPGAGIGNNRQKINQETVGIPVIALGVPTVVEASTIIYETLESSLTKQGYTEKEILPFYESLLQENVQKVFVTPKDIDEEVEKLGEIIAMGIEKFVEMTTKSKIHN